MENAWRLYYNDPVEYEYYKRYGTVSDFHYLKLRGQYGKDVAARIRQRNIDAICDGMRAEHERRRHELEHAHEFTYTESSPFDT